MQRAPSFPSDTPLTAAQVPLRFEDITQDGRIVLEAIPTALGPTVWGGLARDAGIQALYKAGIVPIVSRLVLEGTPGPFPATAVATAEGTSRFVRTDDGRFVLEMWADLHASTGRTYAPRDSAGAGRPELAGRVYAEHVLTRPFAPPDARRVRSLDFDGAPQVRETRPALSLPDALGSLPDGARALEPARTVDRVPITFGLVHTDSNMHVNSLVYLRLFEEAALRRFVALGLGSKFLGRSVEIAYRKPCVAGQTVRVAQQAFEVGGRLGVAAVLVPEADAAAEDAPAPGRPLAYARMQFDA